MANSGLHIPVTDPPPASRLRRIWGAFWRQKSRSLRCPEHPRLDGKLALVTGGNGGIGFEIVRGLSLRGAAVVMASRNQEKAEAACESIRRETGDKPEVKKVACDLSDLESVANCVTETTRLLRGKNVDVLVANAGFSPKSHRLSKQGHEATFATNVLGHHLLTRLLLDAGKLRGSRVVVLTGDIYCLASECTPDYRFKGAIGGMLAYARSKLGNIWFAKELANRFGDLSVYLTHPGAVATDLVLNSAGRLRRFADSMFISSEAGAQTPLICATQPGLENGGYYHNTFGLMKLGRDDPASDRHQASGLWVTCERLCGDYL